MSALRSFTDRIQSQIDKLESAASRKDEQRVKELLQSAELREFINTHSTRGKTAILSACLGGCSSILTVLLAAGADPFEGILLFEYPYARTLRALCQQRRHFECDLILEDAERRKAKVSASCSYRRYRRRSGGT